MTTSQPSNPQPLQVLEREDEVVSIQGSNEQIVFKGDKVGVAFTGTEWGRIREVLVEDNTPITGPLGERIPEYISPDLNVGLFFTQHEWCVIYVTVIQESGQANPDLVEKLGTTINQFPN